MMLSKKQPQNENVLNALECGDFIETILKSDSYIARSEYINKILDFSKDIEFISVLNKSGMLEDYCMRNGLSSEKIVHIINS